MTACVPAVPLPRAQQIFCNRTLNLRQVKAIGYDMDYTLIHYHTEAWEARAYEIAQAKLALCDWPVQGLKFQPQLMIRGLIIDTELGNFIKVNTFGYVKHAFHGTQAMSLEEQRKTYAGVAISLSSRRYVFMNSLFSLSEACLYAQMVDLLDDGRLPTALGYQDLYRKVQASIDEAHVEGELKREIAAHPEKFVELDRQMPQALLDQYHAGKQLLLITNSEWAYTAPMMAYACDRFLPKGMHWRQLFVLTITSARKPGFFSQRQPLFEIASDDGLLRLVQQRRGSRPALQKNVAYQGGSAAMVEEALQLTGDEILYVGDHIYGDVNVTKQVLRWRTALILRDLEADLAANEGFAAQQAALEQLMGQKQRLEFQLGNLRLQLLRAKHAPTIELSDPGATQQELTHVRGALDQLDQQIRPLAEAASRLSNPHWGPLMRAGNDKSHLARQVERYADIYTTRVGNFMWQTPYGYMRALRGSLPHDPSMGPSPSEATRGP